MRAFQLERFFGEREFAARHQLSASDCEAQPRGPRLVEDNRARVLRNLEYLSKSRLVFCPPRAGTVCLAEVDDAERFSDVLFRETGVLALPSTVFDFGNRHIRLGLGRDDFPQALTATSELDR